MDNRRPSDCNDTIGAIFRESFEQYVSSYGPLPTQQYRVAHALERCRTEALGGHLYRCDRCGHELAMYNSCRNRHCPQCQAFARMQWVEKRMDEALPVPYFHVVFTLPSQLRDIALRNREVIYSILFQSVSATLLELAGDPKRLGGTIGLIAVLHTWTQTLEYHPHIHCLVPGGVLGTDPQRWIGSRQDFLLPVVVLRKLFRGKFLAGLRKAIDAGEVHFEGVTAMYGNGSVLQQLIDELYGRHWVVYVKEPFETPDNVIKYLARYTHRVAISNQRIVNADNGLVTFRYMDRARKSVKQMTLSATEFIRRFMTHVLTPGFVRIRYYGFMANRCRGELVPLCKRLLGVEPGQKRGTETAPQRWYETVKRLTGKDPRRCPACREGTMCTVAEIEPLEQRALVA